MESINLVRCASANVSQAVPLTITSKFENHLNWWQIWSPAICKLKILPPHVASSIVTVSDRVALLALVPKLAIRLCHLHITLFSVLKFFVKIECSSNCTQQQKEEEMGEMCNFWLCFEY